MADSLCVKAYSTLSASVLELMKDVEKLSRDLQHMHSAKPLFVSVVIHCFGLNGISCGSLMVCYMV